MAKWAAKPVTLSAIDFDGDSVIATVKRLSVSDMAELVGKQIDMGAPSGQIEICRIGGEILPKVLDSLTGLKDEEGNEIGKDGYIGAIGEFYFAPLTASLLMKTIEASSIKAQEKN